MECKKLFEIIDGLNDKYIALWEKICNIESPTDFKEGLDRIVDLLEALAKEKGWKTERIAREKAGDTLFVTTNSEASSAPVSISAHIDTVHPLGLFGYPPVKFSDGKIYGPGVCDCKGGLAAGLMAMDALRKCGFKSRPVQLLVQTDEENSSVISGGATISDICKRAEGSVAFLNLEGHTPGEACLKRKGIATYTFKVTGVEAHSSACAEKGSNAICDAAHKIIELEKFKYADGITCNCGVISGGTVPNTVAGYCEFKANFRFNTSEELCHIKEFVKKLSETAHVPGCTCVAEIDGIRPAMELTERNEKLLEKMNCIYSQNGLPTLNASHRTGGSDAANVTEYGIACVDSIGAEGGCIHSINEYAHVDSLSRAAKRVATVVYCID